MIKKINGAERMSLNQYYEVINLIKEKPSVFEPYHAQTEKLIEEAENALNLSFPDDYRQFLLDYGTGDVGIDSIFGVVNDDFDNSSSPDVVWVTLQERKAAKLRNDLIIIYDDAEGGYYVLDYSRLNANHEPKVVLYIPGHPENEQPYTLIANDFSDLFYKLVTAEITLERGDEN